MTTGPAERRCTACCRSNATRSSGCTALGWCRQVPPQARPPRLPARPGARSASPPCCGCWGTESAATGQSTPRPAVRTPWPDWLEWKPNRIWSYDFTHFTRARRAAIAILDAILAEDLPDAQPGAGHARRSAGAPRCVMDGDVVFLSVFGDHWLSPRPAARPRGDRPYDCTVDGRLSDADRVLELPVGDRGRAGLLHRHRAAAPMTGDRDENGVRDHGLAMFFGLIFLAALIGQAFDRARRVQQPAAHRRSGTDRSGQYVTSSSFAVDVAENWQSEYLQFFLYIYATVWLVQKGSPESKPLGKQGRESDEEQKVGEHADENSPAWARSRGFRLDALLPVAGPGDGRDLRCPAGSPSPSPAAARYNEQQLSRPAGPVSWTAYVVSSDFWNRTLQNWQSEFLAVGSMVVLSIYLRQRGSPESKPVGPPTRTGIEG